MLCSVLRLTSAHFRTPLFSQLLAAPTLGNGRVKGLRCAPNIVSAILSNGLGDLLVKADKVQQGVDHARAAEGGIHALRKFDAEPGAKGTAVRAAKGDPLVAAVAIVAHGVNQLCRVLQRLVGGEVRQVF